jgi:hypothetical protein
MGKLQEAAGAFAEAERYLDALRKQLPHDFQIRLAWAEYLYLRSGLELRQDREAAARKALKQLAEADQLGLFDEAARRRELETDPDLKPLAMQQSFQQLLNKGK